MALLRMVVMCQVTQLLREYLATYELAPVFTEDEVLHYLKPVEGVIETHVVESKGKLSAPQGQHAYLRAWADSYVPPGRIMFVSVWVAHIMRESEQGRARMPPGMIRRKHMVAQLIARQSRAGKSYLMQHVAMQMGSSWTCSVFYTLPSIVIGNTVVQGKSGMTDASGCCADGRLTDMLSFYTLPSTVIGNPTYKTLKAAFMYYTVAKHTPLQQLMTDALILACSTCETSPCPSSLLRYASMRFSKGQYWHHQHSLHNMMFM